MLLGNQVASCKSVSFELLHEYVFNRKKKTRIAQNNTLTGTKLVRACY